MAAPFFQGNIQDLMGIAGPSQGSFLLGQLLREQQEAQKAQLEASRIQNLLNQQKYRHAEDLHPLEQDMKRANIGNIQAQGRESGVRADSGDLANQVTRTRGVPAIAKEGDVKAETEALKLQEKKKDAMINDLIQLEWYSSPPEWDKGFYFDIGETLKKHGFDLFDPRALSILRQASSKESWDAARKKLYENTTAARELKFKADLEQRNQLALQEAKANAALELARAKAASAERMKTAKNLQEALTRYLEAEYLATQAGDKDLAAKYNAEALRIKEQILEIERMKAGAKQEGSIDTGALGGVPTKEAPKAEPIAPAGTPPNRIAPAIPQTMKEFRAKYPQYSKYTDDQIREFVRNTHRIEIK